MKRLPSRIRQCSALKCLDAIPLSGRLDLTFGFSSMNRGNSLDRYYRYRAASYDDESPWMRNQRLLTSHLHWADIKPTAVLDVATGTGIIASLFKDPRTTVVGLDYSTAMLEFAGNRLKHLVRGSGQCLPFRDNQFDIVTCRQGLHYLLTHTALDEFFRVCRRVVVVSEIICLSEHDVRWWWPICKVLSPGRLTIFTIESLVNLIQEAGFHDAVVVRHETKNSLRKWIGKRPLSSDVVERLTSKFHNAPDRIKNSYGVRRKRHDFEYLEHWAIVTARKDQSKCGTQRG